MVHAAQGVREIENLPPLSLRHLKDEDLLSKTKSLVGQERELTTVILRHLREVERRRLFAARGFSSLFEYCTLELGYSSASAQRRIASMRLLKVLPEIEEKIASGSLNLSNIAQAVKFFKSEEKNHQPLNLVAQREVLQQLEVKSTREAERELVSRSSNPVGFLSQDQIKPITPTHSEVRFVADQELLNTLEKIKGLLGHEIQGLTTAELIAEMARITLEKLESKKFAQLKARTSRAGSNLAVVGSESEAVD